MHIESSSEIKTFKEAHRGTSKTVIVVILNHLSAFLDPWKGIKEGQTIGPSSCLGLQFTGR